MVQSLLRQFAVRARVWTALVTLAVILVLPVPMLIRGQNLLLSQREALTEQLAEVERSLLAASVRIASSRAQLLEYIDERVLTPGGALSDASQGLGYLDTAALTLPPGILLQEDDGTRYELGAGIRNLRVALSDYQLLIGQVQAARLAEDRQDAAQLSTQALSLASSLAADAERLAGNTASARDAAEIRVRSDARGWIARTLLAYGVSAILSLTVAVVLFRSVTVSVDSLRSGAERLGAGPFGATTPAPVEVEGEDELAIVATALNTLSAGLARSYQVLETRVEERTESLLRRHGQLQSIIEVAQAAADASTMVDAPGEDVGGSDLDSVLQQIVNVVQRRLSLYYVGLFLVEEATVSGSAAAPSGTILLRAGTGDAGARMVARGHSLAIGEGMIGWAVANGQARVALEVETDLLRVMNPDLPATRSEAAIPLRILTGSRGSGEGLGGDDGLNDSADGASNLPDDPNSLGGFSALRRTVIGALTVQADTSDAFDEEMVELLQVMADLLAVMIQNARRYRDIHMALGAVRQSYGMESQEGWLRVLGRQAAGTGYLSTGSGNLVQASGPWDQRMREAMVQRRMLEQEGTLVVPISTRGQTIGVLRLTRTAPSDGKDGRRGGVEKSPGGGGATTHLWTAKEVGLIRTIVEQLGLALDSARLYEDTQIGAARERTAREVADRMRATLDWDELMKTAVREIGRAIDASHVYIQWEPPQQEPLERRNPETPAAIVGREVK